MTTKIEFTFNNLGAKAIAHINGKKLDKITFPVKLPRQFYYSFMNDATSTFYEKYPQYK